MNFSIRSFLVSVLFLSLGTVPALAKFDAKDIEAIRAIVLETQEQASNQVPIGTILPFGGTAALPPEFIECDGRSLNVKDYGSLFNVIGNTYGSPGEGQFMLPDLRGRAPIGAGEGDNLSKRCLGESCGQEKHILTLNEMPSHDHNFDDPGHKHKIALSTRVGAGTPNVAAGAGVDEGDNDSMMHHKDKTNIQFNAQGGNAAHNIMQPSLVVRFMIKWIDNLNIQKHSRVPSSVNKGVTTPSENTPVFKK